MDWILVVVGLAAVGFIASRMFSSGGDSGSVDPMSGAGDDRGVDSGSRDSGGGDSGGGGDGGGGGD